MFVRKPRGKRRLQDAADGESVVPVVVVRPGIDRRSIEVQVRGVGRRVQ